MQILEQVLEQVLNEHHARLRSYVDRLYAPVDCLGGDCPNAREVSAELAELRGLLWALKEQLIPHMEAVEAAVYPTLERIMSDRETRSPMRAEHEEIRQLVASVGEIVDSAGSRFDRGGVLALRRLMLRLHVLLKTHLEEEDLYLPILEDKLTPAGAEALARAVGHLAAARL